MAELTNKKQTTIEELEESLGYKLPTFIKESESEFFERVGEIAELVLSQKKRAVFISGPTSSGKTTFTDRLTRILEKAGAKAAYLSLDDYYVVKDLTFDEDGRPDYETKDVLDLKRACADIKSVLDNQTVIPPKFDFKTRESVVRDASEAITLSDDGILIVEGLHGLSMEVAGSVPSELVTKIFIAPYGDVYADSRLFDSNDIRLLRRIVRDYHHRNATALTTVDYWPMIEKSEEAYYNDYLARADYHINSFLRYEVLVTAPMALDIIEESLRGVADGTIPKSIFMEKSNQDKCFADLTKALKRCEKLKECLKQVPIVDATRVPSDSILNEFIGNN